MQEAYKMVNEDKARKILADKKLADANGKVNNLHALCMYKQNSILWPKSCDKDINFGSLSHGHM